MQRVPIGFCFVCGGFFDVGWVGRITALLRSTARRVRRCAVQTDPVFGTKKEFSRHMCTTFSWNESLSYLDDVTGMFDDVTVTAHRRTNQSRTRRRTPQEGATS